MENNESFEFTYSAPEQEEIRRIRAKYLPKEERETKLEKLRQLDQSVTKKATAWSIAVGTLSTLILGIGMSCCLVWTDVIWNGVPLIFLGIPVGLVGLAGVGCAFPLYRRIVEREQKRVTPEILRLTEELMQ